jgi:hypothetical protein
MSDILIAPISGGFFVNQLAGLYCLAQQNYAPDLIWGASGGGVTSTIYALSDFKAANLKRNAAKCDCSLFVSDWLPRFSKTFSLLVGIAKGSLFDHSTTTIPTFDGITTSDMLISTEIWILAFNNKTEKAALFCNRAPEDSVVSSTEINHLDTMCAPRIYVDGDVEYFANVLLASASIPAYVPPRKIKESFYTDGGLIYASPLTPFSSYLRNLESFHLVYLCGYDLESVKVKYTEDPQSIFQHTINATDYMVKGNLLSERILVLTILSFRASKNRKVIRRDMTLQEYFEMRSEFQFSYLEVYPTRLDSVNVLEFSSKDCINIMETQIEYIACCCWYVLADSN